MKRRNIIYIICFIIYAFLQGCEDLNNPGEIKIKNSLFYELKVYDTVQHVYIYRNPDISGHPEDKAADPYIDLFNKNAEVTITDRIEGKTAIYTLALDTVKDSYLSNPYTLYFTNSKSFKTKPLTNYYLNVSTGGDIITGSVTTPGDFQILAPVKGEVIKGSRNLDKYTFKWNSSQNAKGYIARLYLYDKFLNRQVWLDYRTQDTTMDFKSMQLFSMGMNSGDLILRIIAYDDNYFQHYFNKKESVGLNGAYGCFSSSVVKEVRFFYSSTSF